MIAALSLDLVTRIKAIANGQFGSGNSGDPIRVGLALGATEWDPLVEKCPYPAAWVMYIGDQNADPNSEQGTCAGVRVKMNFVVKVFVDYGSQADLLANQYPLLSSIVGTIHGRQAQDTSGSPIAMRWKYEGQSLDMNDAGRLIYDQMYSVIAVLPIA